MALFDVMADDGEGARTLRHLAMISFDRVLQFSQVPDWMRTGRLPQPDQLPIGTARSAGQVATEAMRSKGQTKDRIWANLPTPYCGSSDWMTFAGRELTFPEPTWPGSPCLRPITDVEALDDARERFKNCIHTLLDDCLSGTKALYIWEGEEPAMASVLQISGMVIIDQINGVRNEPVSYETLLAIMTEFPNAAGEVLDAAPF